MVRRAGLEPARPLGQLILSQSWLPVTTPARKLYLEAPTGFEPVYAVLQTAA